MTIEGTHQGRMPIEDVERLLARLGHKITGTELAERCATQPCQHCASKLHGWVALDYPSINLQQWMHAMVTALNAWCRWCH
jgi:hypothetical protein